MTPRTANAQRFRTCLLFLAVAGAAFLVFHRTGVGGFRGWTNVRSTLEGLISERPDQARPTVTWPPSVGEPYPDLQLVDQDGRRTSLSEFRGKVILVEPVGMPCRACIAFAGGHEHGPFDGVPPQAALRSIHYYARQYGNVDLDDPRIVVVQILFYNERMAAPSADDARVWASHFGMQRSKNQVVLAAEPHLLGKATYEMIPGFQLVDKDFILRCNSTGRRPQHDLYTELLPQIRRLLDE